MQPTLSRDLVTSPEFRARTDLLPPDPAHLDLPEKALQFGTGAFLRGFVDYFLDQANRAGRFNGRVVMVGSTGSGRDRVLNDQDGLFTLVIQGVSEGAIVRERRVISSVSRAISSADQWDEVLACARNPQLELVFSNTTEVGIALDEADDPDLQPPRSFPGKLARFLLERGRAVQYSLDAGIVVIPCELIENNGDRLRDIVLALAERWGVEADFARWVRAAVPFCNTLVDRIVPGTPDAERLEALHAELGYRDGMLTTCEVYRLFAIEGGNQLRDRLAFASTDPGVVISPDITPFRERKVRVLNGTHTAMVPTALLCGHETVQEAVEDDLVGRFVRRLMFAEIVPTLDAEGAEGFARDVFDRFSNPFIRHALLDITLQTTMKMRVRNVPTIERYAARLDAAPPSFAFGFAAFLAFMRGDVQERARARGAKVPPDDQAEALRTQWEGVRASDEAGLRSLVRSVLSDRGLWEHDLTAVKGFEKAVGDALIRIESVGARAALEEHLRAVEA
jgi:tagaturonate reductase